MIHTPPQELILPAKSETRPIHGPHALINSVCQSANPRENDFASSITFGEKAGAGYGILERDDLVAVTVGLPWVRNHGGAEDPTIIWRDSNARGMDVPASRAEGNASERWHRQGG